MSVEITIEPRDASNAGCACRLVDSWTTIDESHTEDIVYRCVRLEIETGHGWEFVDAIVTKRGTNNVESAYIYVNDYFTDVGDGKSLYPGPDVGHSLASWPTGLSEYATVVNDEIYSVDIVSVKARFINRSTGDILYGSFGDILHGAAGYPIFK